MDVGTLRDGTPPTSPRATADPTEKATMDALIIRGGRPLNGRVDVSGAKSLGVLNFDRRRHRRDIPLRKTVVI